MKNWFLIAAFALCATAVCGAGGMTAGFFPGDRTENGPEAGQEADSTVAGGCLPLEEWVSRWGSVLRLEKRFAGQEVVLRCRVSGVEEATGYSDLRGYRYKVTHYVGALFGEWFSNYEWVGYTNDESFLQLSYPCTVTLKGVFVEVEPRRSLVFKDCVLAER